MTITAAFVLFAVLWFLALLTILPLRVRTQGEDGAVVRGTPASAPTDANIRRKLAWATVVAVVLWVPIFSVIVWGGITIRDIDVWGRM
jgi:predicted secreted protein